MCPNIKNFEYATWDDYKNRPALNKSAFTTSSIDKLSLIRCAYTVGVPPNSLFPLEVLEWKESIIHAFIDFSDPTTLKIKNLEVLESSEKVSVSYFLGMLFTQFYMQKKYSVRFLAHLKNRGIYPKTKSGNKSPDFWGMNSLNTQSYLVEAKGSLELGNCIKFKTMEDACKQVSDVVEVEFQLDRVKLQSYKGTTLKKLIVATLPNTDKELLQHIVDPEAEEGEIIKVDGDIMVYEYYSTILRMFQMLPNKEIEKHSMKFRVIETKSGLSIGLLEELYQKLNSLYKVSEDGAHIENGMNRAVNKVLDKLHYETFINENIVIGQDGVIVVEN